MKRIVYGAMMLAFAWVGPVKGSDPVGIYARVDRVSMEPNDDAPERIKIWGAFSLATGRGDNYNAPECGYLYFQIVSGQEKQCRAEWADFKRMAGTGQVIAFGNRYRTKLAVRTIPLQAPKGPAADPQKIAHWIADLDSDQFAVREKATRELEKQGESAQPALRKALESHPKPESRKRLERLTEGDRPDPYPLGVGVMKIETGTNYDTDYGPIKALLDMPTAASPDNGSLVPKGHVTLVARNIRDHLEARFTVIDQSAVNIQRARSMVNGDTTFIHETYAPSLVEGMDLVVIPLSFAGDREAIYRDPPTRALVIHDWLWHKRGQSAVVSLFLLKRLNLVLS